MLNFDLKYSIDEPVTYEDNPENLNEYVEYADIDGDGEVSQQEYNLFISMDLDQDGEISQEEYSLYRSILGSILSSDNNLSSLKNDLERQIVKNIFKEFEAEQSLVDSIANNFNKAAQKATNAMTDLAKGTGDIASGIADLAPKAPSA